MVTKHTLKFYAAAILILLIGFPLISQTVSDKKDISVFSLYYDSSELSSAQAMNIDTEIQSVFTNIGRFNVIGTEFRLESGSVNEFIQQIRKMKEADAEIPREVQLGREVFTEADFRELTGSFLVVTPSVLRFDTAYEEGSYETTLKLAVSIIDVDSASTLKTIRIEITGTSEDQSESISNAIDSIYHNLEYEIRKMPVFQIKTGVIQVHGLTVDMELGRNMGIRKGDEYVLKEQGVTSSGYEYSNDVGLVVVKDVQPEFSRTQLLYGNPELGDQLQEIPRAGANLGFYANFLARKPLENLEGEVDEDLVLGMRATVTRGFYSVRPVFGAEIPFVNIGGGLDFLFIPFQAYAGAEGNLYLGRLQISPMAAVAYGGLYPILPKLANAIAESNDGQKWINSHFGGRVQLGLTYLISRDIRLYAEAGGAAMRGLFDAAASVVDEAGSYESFLNSYAGTYFGGGITFKL